MLKIIYIANARIPTEKAHGIQIMQMCQALAQSGVALELFLPWRFNKIKKEPFEYYGLLKNFKIKKIPSFDINPGGNFLRPWGFLIQTLSFGFFIFFYLIFRRADVIYSRDLLPVYLLSFFKKNIYYEGHRFPRNFIFYKKLFQRLRGLIVLTQGLKQAFISNGLSPNKILVAPDGVDIKMFAIKDSALEARKKLNLPRDKKIILYAGHLFQWKGAGTLAQASQYLPDDYLIIFIGGMKEDIKKFKIQCSKLNLKNILILGYRSYQEIPWWLKAADVLVLPNSAQKDISKYFTSPLKMFEYMAAQKPIVASDLPSIREVLNENNAVLIQPDKARVLAQGISQVLINSELRGRISSNAFRDVQSYTWQKRAEKIINFLKI